MRLEDCGLPFDACERHEEQQRPARAVNIDKLIRKVGMLAAKRGLDLEAVSDKAAETTAPSEC